MAPVSPARESNLKTRNNAGRPAKLGRRRSPPPCNTLFLSQGHPTPPAPRCEGQGRSPAVAPGAAGTPCCAVPCCVVPPCAPGQEPVPPLGLSRLHDVRPGGAQLPRPEGEVAPAALENGMHGDLLSTEQKAGGGGRGGGGGGGAPLLPSPPAQPSRQRRRPGTAAPWRFRFQGRAGPGGAGSLG